MMIQVNTNTFSKTIDMVRWQGICNFLSSEENKFMRPSVCVGCGFVMLYDKDGKKYKIKRGFTREMVDQVITTIKTINGIN